MFATESMTVTGDPTLATTGVTTRLTDSTGAAAGAFGGPPPVDAPLPPAKEARSRTSAIGRSGFTGVQEYLKVFFC
jgi:hypothetical protein